MIQKYPSLSPVLTANNDQDYQEAACFILANLSEEEASQLNSDSLIFSINTSINTWRKVPWKVLYRQTEFLEYVLPYRVANEPLEYFWKWDFPDRLGVNIIESNSLPAIARQINSKVLINLLTDALGNTAQSYSSLILGASGKCDDRAILTTMAMRSNGIPSAFESIPCWGNANCGHSFCSIIKPDNKLLIFQNPSDNGETTSFVHKVPKIYRKMFSIQTNTPLYRHKGTEPIPTYFSSFDRKDVTDLHNMIQRDVPLDISISEHKIVYLSVFSPDGWIPVAYTENKGTNTLFSNVGTGEEASDDNYYFCADQMRPGILYLPSIYLDDEMQAISDPIIVSAKQIEYVKCNPAATEKITVYRKYPLSKRIQGFANEMQNGVFEGANQADFSDAVELYYIDTIPLSRPQRIAIHKKQKFKYYRYRKAKGTFSIAEMRALNNAGNEIKGKLISCNTLACFSEIRNLFDYNNVSYFSLPNGLDIWAGMAFDVPQHIAYIEFCPRTDDNDISPGDTYELFYWDNEWHSLECKQATDYQITFERVPCGALLWLRNLIKGKEERPFIMNKGKQLWW